MEWTLPVPLRLQASQAGAECYPSGVTGGSTLQVTPIGLDSAKQVFVAVGTDRRGHQVWRKRLQRGQVLEFFAQQGPCLVGLEACGGAQYWARQFQAYGHEVKVVAPRHVRAFRRGQKNDYHDAGAIGEAARQPGVRG